MDIDYRIHTDYTERLQNLFNMMTINGKYNIVGSANFKPVFYSADYDLNEIDNFKKDNSQSIYNIFKEKFINAKKDKNIFILDFKCGTKDGKPLRWSYNDIIKGINNGVRFVDALKQKSTIKLDMVANIDGAFVDITDTYFFKFGEITNYHPEELEIKYIIQNIIINIDELLKDNNYMKVLKRIFTINELQQTNKKLRHKLINYFNSYVGLMNKGRSEFDVLLLLLDQTFRPVDINDIKYNLQLIKYNLSSVVELNYSNKIDKLNNINDKSKMRSETQKLRDDLYNIVNVEAKKYYINLITDRYTQN